MPLLLLMPMGVKLLKIEITEPDELVVSGTLSNFNGFGITCNGADDGLLIYL